MSLTRRKPRPRVHGKLSKAAPTDFTTLQQTMHEQSVAQRVSSRGAGAFGGITRVARMEKAIHKAVAAIRERANAAT